MDCSLTTENGILSSEPPFLLTSDYWWSSSLKKCTIFNKSINPMSSVAILRLPDTVKRKKRKEGRREGGKEGRREEERQERRKEQLNVQVFHKIKHKQLYR